MKLNMQKRKRASNTYYHAVRMFGVTMRPGIAQSAAPKTLEKTLLDWRMETTCQYTSKQISSNALASLKIARNSHETRSQLLKVLLATFKVLLARNSFATVKAWEEKSHSMYCSHETRSQLLKHGNLLAPGYPQG